LYIAAKKKILKGNLTIALTAFIESMNKDLFSEIKFQLLGGTLSVDDTVIDKPYSNPNLAD